MQKIAIVIVTFIGVCAGPSCTAADPQRPQEKADLPPVQEFVDVVKEALLITEVKVTNIDRAPDNSVCQASFKCKSQRGWTILEGSFVWVNAEGADKPKVTFIKMKPFFVSYKGFAGAVDPFDTDKNDEAKNKVWFDALARMVDAMERVEKKRPAAK